MLERYADDVVIYAPNAQARADVSSGSHKLEAAAITGTTATITQVREIRLTEGRFFVTAEDVGVSWLPLYHDMGLIGCVFPAILGPGPLTLIPPERFLARPALWLRALSRWRGTVSPAPDFAYALCVERITECQISSRQPFRQVLLSKPGAGSGTFFGISELSPGAEKGA